MRGWPAGLGRVAVALAALAGLAWPLVAYSGQGDSSVVADPVTVTSYRADFRLAADGTLRADETLTTDMPSGRHGIFRFWDVADPGDPHARLIPSDITVTRDGQTDQAELSWTDDRRFRVLRVGSPDETLSPGRHVYTIGYVTRGTISPPTVGGSSPERGGSVFYWNLVPQGWQMPIERSRLSVHLPARAGAVRCVVGLGAGRPCSAAGSGTRTVTVETSALPPHTPVTVRVGLSATPPERTTLPWTVRYDPVLGRSLPVAGMLLVLSLVALVAGWFLARQSEETPPPYPVTYEPPAGLGPVQTAYLVTERVGSDRYSMVRRKGGYSVSTGTEAALVATLLYLAEKGLVRLTRQEEGGWVVEGLADPSAWASVDPVSRSLGESLGLTRTNHQFRVTDSPSTGEKLKAVQQYLARDTRAWARDSGLVSVDNGELVARVLVYVAAAVAVLAFSWNPFAVTLTGLPAAAFVIGGFTLVLGGVGTRRTTQGRELWSRAGGFQRMLSTPSSIDRFDFSGRRELYTAYIPYAVAFGCADAWAEKYETETGEPAPTPVWIHGVSGAGMSRSLAGDLGSFHTALAASIAAYQATQSSSGRGGGGFSGGGGGGGGGGGSW